MWHGCQKYLSLARLLKEEYLSNINQNPELRLLINSAVDGILGLAPEDNTIKLLNWVLSIVLPFSDCADFK